MSFILVVTALTGMSSFLVTGYSFSFIFFNHWVCLNLCYISLLVYSFVMFVENNAVLKAVGNITMLMALLFFGSTTLLILFISYELVMFPIVLGIYLYGSQPEKISSIYYALIYTSGFSMPFLVEVIKIEGLLVSFYVSPVQYLICTGLFLGKTPVFILHVWLPKTHVEAPTSVSILLAGILLKVGVFGLIKIVMFFNITSFLITLLSLLGMVVIPLITSLSVESKVITANSSVTHMNLTVYGLNILSNISMSGSYLLMVSHGFISSMIFCLVGILYNINGVRVIFFLTGLISWSLYFTISASVVFLANAGMPPMLSFWGELIILISLISLGSLLVLFLLVYLIYSFYYSIFILIHFSKIGGSLLVSLRMLSVLLLSGVLVFSSTLFLF